MCHGRGHHPIYWPAILPMLAYVGANGTTTPGFGTDYAELGIISGNSANVNDWVVRVRSYDQLHGTTWFATGVSRASVAQTWVHLGSNSKTYQDFWYDNFRVVPEPASFCLLALGLVAFAAREPRRR